jgi:site-specific DNA-methyltransferase (adenine-specific)
MKSIPDGSIDAIITDPPYGTTACKWDTVIPFDPMWEQLKRIIKSNGAIVLFGSEPFSSALRMSNIKQYKYDWVYVKSQAQNFLNSKKQPLRNNECISIFYKNQCTYNPQMEK